jgi:hypothetical protein
MTLGASLTQQTGQLGEGELRAEWTDPFLDKTHISGQTGLGYTLL